MKQNQYYPIDLRSDTVTKPSLAMREAMMKAEVGDDVFGEDPTVNRLQEKAAELFKKEAGLFMASGTMANEVAIKTHTQPGDEVITDELSHIVNFETGAPGLLSGVNLHTLPTANGILTADQVRKAIRPDALPNPHTSLISLENTHNYGGGSIYPIETIQSIASVAREYSLKIHLDGARIFNASIASGVLVYEYATYCDSVSFCLSKGLGAPVGSVLLGTKDFIEKARRYRKIFGGGMRQVGILAAAGIYALDNNIERLADDHYNARLLAQAFHNTETFDIYPDEVKTNIIIVKIKKPSLTSQQAAGVLREYGILMLPFGARSIRAVTHLDVSKQDILEACKRIGKFF
jgi:threonine aldolase